MAVQWIHQPGQGELVLDRISQEIGLTQDSDRWLLPRPEDVESATPNTSPDTAIEKKIWGRKAQLTALSSGVLIVNHMIQGVEGIDKARRKAKSRFNAGSRIAGPISAYRVEPENGGYLCLRRGMTFTHMFGLVDPESGEPRVDLDILAINRRRRL